MKLIHVLVIIAAVAAAIAFPAENEELLASSEKWDQGKMIIDTDCGADDAGAILLALAHQEDFDILAITTSVGNTLRDNAIINVLKTQRVLGTKIPVYPGAQNSTLHTPPFDYFYGNDGFGDVPDPNPPSLNEAEQEHAVSLMMKLVRENPGEIIIVALGPLTNIAMAVRLDPSFADNVKAIYWTGGSVGGMGNIAPGIEFNAHFDPAANYIVFNTTLPVIMCPWEMIWESDVTLKWRLEVLGVVDSAQMKFLNAVEVKSFRFGGWEAADLKTMAIALNSKIVERSSAHHVEAIYEGEFTKGAFMVDYNDRTGRTKNAIIIHDINKELFKEMLLKGLAYKPSGMV